MMDADGQDVPAEIPRLLDALDQRADLATRPRTALKERPIERWTSVLHNSVTARVSGADGGSSIRGSRR